MLATAFEFLVPTGNAGGMIAGGAVADWQNLFLQNPALIMEAERFQAGLAYSRPYGLDCVDWGRICAVVRKERWGSGVGFGSLSFGNYRESDLQLNFGVEPIKQVKAGLGMHLMAVDIGRYGVDVVPAFDLGFAWQAGVFRLGAAGFRTNLPRFRNGDELPGRFVLAGAMRPVETLVLALDLSREGGKESAAFGMDFRLVPPLELRIGVGYEPLLYAAGFGIRVGVFKIDYAYRFHPQLKETHIFGMQAAWH
mgnify:CR=1 FL=1